MRRCVGANDKCQTVNAEGKRAVHTVQSINMSASLGRKFNMSGAT